MALVKTTYIYIVIVNINVKKYKNPPLHIGQFAFLFLCLTCRVYFQYQIVNYQISNGHNNICILDKVYNFFLFFWGEYIAPVVLA